MASTRRINRAKNTPRVTIASQRSTFQMKASVIWLIESEKGRHAQRNIAQDVRPVGGTQSWDESKEIVRRAPRGIVTAFR